MKTILLAAAAMLLVSLAATAHEPAHAPVTKKGPTCAQVLVDKGFHPKHLTHCKGVEDTCAVALLRRGFHPRHLSRCAVK